MFVCVVGGGTSGAVLASRLAEDRNVTILVIEAGGKPTTNPDIDIPVFADTVRGDIDRGPGEFDWMYQTTPQRFACKGHTNQVRMGEEEVSASPHFYGKTLSRGISLLNESKNE